MIYRVKCLGEVKVNYIRLDVFIQVSAELQQLSRDHAPVSARQGSQQSSTGEDERGSSETSRRASARTDPVWTRSPACASL